MSAIFTTPQSELYVSNGMAEGLVLGWTSLARRLGLASTEAGRAVVEFLERQRVLAPAGVGGFSVTKPPFDSPEPRRVLARLVAELARNLASEQPDGTLIDADWNRVGPYWRCQWLAVLEALHRGLCATLDGLPPLDLKLDDGRRSAVDALHLLREQAELDRLARNGDSRYSLEAELALLNAIAERFRQAGALFPAAIIEQALARKADLEESSGCLDAASRTWRELGQVEGDSERAVLARAFAADLERHRKD
jgi:hypothetical protein